MIKSINTKRLIGVLLTIIFLFTNMTLYVTANFYNTLSPEMEPIVYDFYMNDTDRGFYFFEGWNNFSNCSASISDRKLKITPTGNDPHFFSSDKLGLNASLYRYVKIKMKNGTSVNYGSVYFITDTDTVWNESKRVTFYVRPNDVKYTEYVLDMSTNPTWAGTIRQIRIDPVDNYGVGDISIDRISFYIDGTPSDIIYDFDNDGDTEGWYGQSCTYDVADRRIEFSNINHTAYFFSQDGIAIDASQYRYIKIRMRNGTPAQHSMIYFTTYDDQVWDMDKLYYRSDIVPYDQNYTDYIYDMSLVPTWEGIIKQLRIDIVSGNSLLPGEVWVDSIGFYTGEIVRDVVYNFNTDGNFEGWYGTSATYNVANGRVEVSNINTAPYFYSADGINIDTFKYDKIKVRMRNGTPAQFSSLYFITYDDQVWGTDKLLFKSDIIPNDSNYTEYIYDMSSVPTWNGVIKQIRLDIVIGDGLLPGEVWVDSIEIIPVQKPLEIIYDFSNGNQGWTAQQHCTVNNSNGIMQVNNNGTAPLIQSKDLLNWDASQYKYMKITMKNNTSSNFADLFWITEEDENWDARKSQKFIINENDDGYTEYIVGLGQNQHWKGKIRQIRIAPSHYHSNGSSQIDTIIITKMADIRRQNHIVREGMIDSSATSYLEGWELNENGGEIIGNILDEKTDDFKMRLPYTDPFGSKGVALFNDTSTSYNVSAWKNISEQKDGLLRWEFEFALDNVGSDGVTWRLFDGFTEVISFVTGSSSLWVKGPGGTHTYLQGLQNYEWYTLRVTINMDTQTFDVKVNGVNKTANHQFANSIEKIDRIYVGTPNTSAVQMAFSSSIYKLGYLYERYTISPGSHDFVKPATGYIDFTLKVRFHSTTPGFEVQLTDAGLTDAAVITTEGGNICYINSSGQKIVLWNNFKPVVWYTLRIKANIMLNTADFIINGITAASISFLK